MLCMVFGGLFWENGDPVLLIHERYGLSFMVVPIVLRTATSPTGLVIFVSHSMDWSVGGPSIYPVSVTKQPHMISHQISLGESLRSAAREVKGGL